MLKKYIYFKTSCHTRLFKPNVFTIRTWLLDFLLQPVIINTLQNIVKISLKKIPPTPLHLLISSLDYSVTRLLSECDFSPLRGRTFGKLLYSSYIIALVLLTASRQRVNQCIGEYGEHK